jgi:hypothetical protein
MNYIDHRVSLWSMSLFQDRIEKLNSAIHGQVEVVRDIVIIPRVWVKVHRATYCTNLVRQDI